ncbi:MAG: DUF58 domain-containing protein [Bdellovibrionia bacterium]
MLSQELLKKVRLIEISTRRVVDEVVSGQYKSHFKGQGVQFSEHRLYVAGDDVRHIDWKVSARTREPLIKKFDEERELNVFLVVDISGSQSFGSKDQLKSEVAAQLGGVLAYAASHTGDQVGLLLFAGEVERVIPPRKGRQHILRLIRELLVAKPTTPGTDLASALESTGRIMKHRGVIFLISDFMAQGYERALRKLAKKHDVVALQLSDEREKRLPDLGQVLFFHPETEQECLVDTSSYEFRKWFTQYQKEFETKTRSVFKSNRVESLVISTQENYGDAVIRFFQARSRKRKS